MSQPPDFHVVHHVWLFPVGMVIREQAAILVGWFLRMTDLCSLKLIQTRFRVVKRLKLGSFWLFVKIFFFFFKKSILTLLVRPRFLLNIAWSVCGPVHNKGRWVLLSTE